MKYYAVLLPMKDLEKSKLHRQAHLDFLEEQRHAGHIFMYGRMADDAGGLLIYQGEDLETVDAIAKEDPYVTLGARDYIIHEWFMQTDYQIVK